MNNPRTSISDIELAEDFMPDAFFDDDAPPDAWAGADEYAPPSSIPAPSPAAAPPPAPLNTDWTRLLRRRGEKVLATSGNTSVILAHDPRWREALAYNSFRQRIMALKEPPCEQHDKVSEPFVPGRDWTDQDDTRTKLWLERNWGIAPSVVDISQVVRVRADAAAFHPVRAYFDTLTWDNTPRLDDWLVRYFGVEDTPYTRKVGRWWLISAVARIFQPGCEAHHVLILEGAQGLGKSQAVSTLAVDRAWKANRLSDLRSKEVCQELAGRWIIEIPELDAFLRAESHDSKNFFTRDNDQYRPPYEKYVVDVKRQCVFIGTINKNGPYLKDPTGNRRYWPVECAFVRLEELQRDVHLLWAEALLAYRRKEPWWPPREDEAEIQAEQAAREEHDDWESLVAAYLENPAVRLQLTQRKFIPCDDIYTYVLNLEAKDWTPPVQNRVTRVLAKLGYRKKQFRRPGEPRIRGFYRPAPPVTGQAPPSVTAPVTTILE